MNKLKALFVDYVVSLPLSVQLIMLFIIACWVYAILTVDHPLYLLGIVTVVAISQTLLSASWAVGFMPFMLWTMFISGLIAEGLRLLLSESIRTTTDRHYFKHRKP